MMIMYCLQYHKQYVYGMLEITSRKSSVVLMSCSQVYHGHLVDHCENRPTRLDGPLV